MTAIPPKGQRRTPTQRRSIETCEVILEAAARILAEDAPHLVSTNRIAKRAGVSIGTLYQYFDSRDAIVRALADQHAQEMQALLAASVTGHLGAPVREVVPAFLDAMVAAHVLSPRLHLALVRELLADGGATLATIQDPAHAMVVAWLESRRDEVRPHDLDAAASLLTVTVEAAIHGPLMLDPSRLRDPSWRRELEDLLLRYLLP